MPPLNYLNPPPNPFWDFVAGLEDHPFFAMYGRPPSYAAREPANAQEGVAAQTPNEAAAEAQSEKAKGKQSTVEDPPEIDPTTLKQDGAKEAPGACGVPWRGRGRFANALDDNPESPRRGHGCRGRGGAEGRGGPPRRSNFRPHYAFNESEPWWEQRGPPGFGGPWGPGRHHGPPPPPGTEGPRGHGHHHGPPPGFEGRRGPGPHHGPPHHHHRGPHSPSRGTHDGFNLGEFLNKLGQRLGVDLSGAAEGLGLDRFTGPRNNNEADFEPRADVFDTKANYTIHISLPGGKKEDVGVDWDGENSVLRVAGVVHRPGADEELLSHLVVDGRKRETGVFEKAIRLGTKRDPASIDIAGISAKMTDGVLVVKVPKVEIEHKKRDVPISGSSTPSPVRGDGSRNEKESLLDADNEMYDAAATNQEGLEKEAEHHADEATKEPRDDRSETMDYEQPHREKLPEHEGDDTHDESDWEKYGSEDEGEYVKINVD